MSNSDLTERILIGRYRGLNGVSGNPKGRPIGARSKLSEEFLEALQADFSTHGVEAIARVRELDPVAYLSAIIRLLPKEIEVREEEGAFVELLEMISASARTGVPIIDIAPNEDAAE